MKLINLDLCRAQEVESIEDLENPEGLSVQEFAVKYHVAQLKALWNEAVKDEGEDFDEEEMNTQLTEHFTIVTFPYEDQAIVMCSMGEEEAYLITTDNHPIVIAEEGLDEGEWEESDEEETEEDEDDDMEPIQSQKDLLQSLLESKQIEMYQWVPGTHLY